MATNIDPDCAAGVDCEGCSCEVYCAQRDDERKRRSIATLNFPQPEPPAEARVPPADSLRLRADAEAHQLLTEIRAELPVMSLNDIVILAFLRGYKTGLNEVSGPFIRSDGS